MLLKQVKIIINFHLWYYLRFKPAGKSLIYEAIDDVDENTATLVGILLTRGSDRTVDLIRKSGQKDQILIDILKSINTPSAIELVRQLLIDGFFDEEF